MVLSGIHRSSVCSSNHENIVRCGQSDAKSAITHLQIIPDSRIDNKNVIDILQTVASMFLPILNRWNGKGLNKPDRASWEIIISKEMSNFCLTVPGHWKSVMQKQIAVVWPRATIKEVEEPLSIKPTSVAKLELKNHFMFSIKTDMRSLGILPSLLEVKKMLGDNDKIAVQILFDPAPGDWWQDASNAYEEFLSGTMPMRTQLNPKVIGMTGVKALTWATLELISVMTEVMTNEEQKPVDISGIDKATALREKPIGKSVADKLKGDALDITISIAVQADNSKMAETLLRSVWYSFRTLDGDNSFKLTHCNVAKVWPKILMREPSFVKLNSDYLSIKECSMLMQLPTKTLQDEFKITSVEHRETDLPKIITSGGLKFGEVRNHGNLYPVHLPIQNIDELCLPRIVIGGMGCGKTKGFGANLAVEAVKNNMSAIVIDPAKGELGDEIESALPKDKVVRIRFGIKPIAIDWREVKHGERTRNRLANEIIAFVEAAADDAGAQTIKFLRAAAKAVPSGRLSEVASIMTDKNYRKKLLLTMREQEKETWLLFDKMTENRQMQIALPVLNRLDVIRGSVHISSKSPVEGSVPKKPILNVT